MKSIELKPWLKDQGATFGEFQGSHLKVFLHGRQSILPMHHRLTNIRHASKIDTIAGAMKALGKSLEIRAV